MNKFSPQTDRWIADIVFAITNGNRDELPLAIKIAYKIRDNWDPKNGPITMNKLYDAVNKEFSAKCTTEKIVKQTSDKITIIL